MARELLLCPTATHNLTTCFHSVRDPEPVRDLKTER